MKRFVLIALIFMIAFCGACEQEKKVRIGVGIIYSLDEGFFTARDGGWSLAPAGGQNQAED